MNNIQAEQQLMAAITILRLASDTAIRRRNMFRFTIFICLLFCFTNSWSWDGYDYGSGSYVEIGKGNLVRPGNSIEVYDYGTGDYSDVEVQSIREGYGNSVEVEVYDYSSGEYRTLDMDR